MKRSDLTTSNVRYVLLDRQTGEVLDEDVRRLISHYARVQRGGRQTGWSYRGCARRELRAVSHLIFAVTLTVLVLVLNWMRFRS